MLCRLNDKPTNMFALVFNDNVNFYLLFLYRENIAWSCMDRNVFSYRILYKKYIKINFLFFSTKDDNYYTIFILYYVLLLWKTFILDYWSINSIIFT